MFEQPVALTTRKLRNARKLRYQYVNNLAAKFNRLEGITSTNGLPTPENSAAESSENEEALQRKRKRIRRRLKSVAGESYSDSESDEVDSNPDNEVVEDEEEDQERKFLNNYELPQESFEKWQDDPSRRVPIRRNKISFTKYQRLRRHAKRKMTTSFELASKRNKIYMDTISEGFEMVDPVDGKPDTFQMKHISILTKLLHFLVYRRDWDAAYTCFALLIRVPKVDIRNIWGIGDLILREREPMKSLEFLSWMSSVYSSRSSFAEEVNHRTPTVFTNGSKTHVPKFATTWMWESLIQCTKNSLETRELEQIESQDGLEHLIERISEMVLAPPYMDASEVWFIYGLCHLIKADILSNHFDGRLAGSARDIASSQVIQHIQSTKSCLQTCLSKGDFKYPKRYIERQLEEFEKRLDTQEHTLDNSDHEVESLHDKLDTQSIESDDGSI